MVWTGKGGPQDVFAGSYESCYAFRRTFLDDNLSYDVVADKDYNPKRVVAPLAKPFPEPESLTSYLARMRKEHRKICPVDEEEFEDEPMSSVMPPKKRIEN